MKHFIIAVLAAFLFYQCAKEPTAEPCTSTLKATCTHNIVNSWQICPSPTTGRDSIFNHSGWTIIDTISVCDTAQWLIDARRQDKLQYDLADPSDHWLMEEFPSTCGCK